MILNARTAPLIHGRQRPRLQSQVREDLLITGGALTVRAELDRQQAAGRERRPLAEAGH